MKKIFLILTVSFFTLTSFSPLVKDIRLQYVFKAGDQYDWVQTTNQKIKQSVGGMNQEIESAVDGTTQLKVTEITSTGAKIEIEYSRLTSRMKTPMGEIVMDSEAENGNNESKVIKAMTRKKFYLFMNKNGVIEKIEGMENLWSDFSSIGLDSLTEITMKKTMERVFGADALKANLEMALAYYPEEKVKKGDNWKRITSGSLNFPLQIESTWKLDDINNATASLSSEGSVTTVNKDQITDLPNGLKTKFNLSGTQRVSGTVNINSGWPSELKISSGIKGSMLLLAGGPIPSDMDVPMEIQTESTFKFVKK